MSLLSVVQNVSLVTGIDVPSQVFSATTREMLEMQRLANEIAIRIMKVNDWQALQAIAVITGDASTEAFSLPTDYDRMVSSGSVWSSRWIWSIDHVINPDTWLEQTVFPYQVVNGRWIIFGNQIHVLPIMGVSETVKFFYVSENIVKPASGSNKTLFTADTDSFVLDEKLLELGMIWQWRANKGLPYAEDMRNYELHLNRAMDSDAGSDPIISGKGRTVKRGVNFAFPYKVGP